jgi:DNA-binding beta-propeller fold protein YncE
VLGTIHDPAAMGRVYVTVSPDDRLALVADENSRAVSVIDLERARTSGYDAVVSTIGRIPMGAAPIAMVYTRDARHVLVTNEVARVGPRWPGGCAREGSSSGETVPEGAIVIVAADRLRTDPAHAIEAALPAGCSPVRLVLSPSGDRAYVTARGGNELRVYDVDSLLLRAAHTLLGQVPVGTSPVGVAVVDDGRRVVLTNSNRFGNERGSLTLIDASRVGEGAAAVIGSIPAGVFPRELRVTPDGRTLLLTNFGSRNVQAFDLTHLPLTAGR